MYVKYDQKVVDQALLMVRDAARKKRGPDQRLFTNSRAVMEFCELLLAGEEREQFVVIFLDTRHRLIEYRVMFYGTVNSCSVYPREIVKAAMYSNAAAIVLAHNHPSGDLTPSEADHKITQEIRKALENLDVRVLDHVIVGDGTFSMAERGLI